jgi:hypothetical protein
MESKVEKEFFQYLIEMGFPKSSIVFEPAFLALSDGRKYRPDFALLDPNTKEILAIIELKERDDSETLRRGILQILNYVTSLRAKGVRGYVVTPSTTGEKFNFYTFTEDAKPKQVATSSFLEFDSLASARQAEKQESLAEEKKETIDQFSKICNSTAAFSILIVVTDFVGSRFDIKILTTERMAMIGVAIALVIIPYVEKFKGLGIEIDRTSKPPKA